MNKRKVLRILHIAGGMIAFITILRFIVITLGVEIFGSEADIARIKMRIVYGLAILIPAIAVAGATGFALTGPSPKGMAAVKMKRMRLIAANGILVLVPAALFLAWKAAANSFDTIFYIVQAIELVAGLVNLVLIGMNIRDGLRMSGRLPPSCNKAGAGVPQ